MQLTLTGSRHACPMHASHTTHPEMAADAHAMSHGSTGTAHQATRLATSEDVGTLGHCDFPCAPATCGSAVTCGTTAAVPTGRGLSPDAFASKDALSLVALAPPSLTTAPESPPPRT
jgi:hypothetical protein